MAPDDNPFSDPPTRPSPKSSRSNPGGHESSKHGSSSSQGRRAHSHESAVEQKPRSSKSKKKDSQHADVIDRLDFTGVGTMFHHDGPFDACAPSRNRHRTQAPMLAWSNSPDSEPYADPAPYPSPAAYGYPESPNRKKVDAIAEAWGIHEPEPYEEFFAGGATRESATPTSSIYNGKDKDSTRSRPRNPPRKSTLPPPQPIFTSESLDMSDTPQDHGATPKRSKSLMQRIRKMRDAPNVPVAGYDVEPSPEEHYKPTHRSQNSFLGKFGNPRAKDASTSPTDRSEAFVYIEPHSPSRKELPATPPADTPYDPYSEASMGGPGIGRKTSLMKKMGRVVKGTKQ